jgi:hypothetical protein
MKKAWWLLAAGFVGIVVGIFLQNTPKDMVKSELLRHKVAYGFAVLYPRSLPDNYTVTLVSASKDDGVILLSVKTDSGKMISVSQQKKPREFDFTSLKGTTEQLTEQGQLKIAVDDNTTTASLVTDTSWVLLRTQDRIDTQVVEDLARSLEPL